MQRYTFGYAISPTIAKGLKVLQALRKRRFLLLSWENKGRKSMIFPLFNALFPIPRTVFLLNWDSYHIAKHAKPTNQFHKKKNIDAYFFGDYIHLAPRINFPLNIPPTTVHQSFRKNFFAKTPHLFSPPLNTLCINGLEAEELFPNSPATLH